MNDHGDHHRDYTMLVLALIGGLAVLAVLEHPGQSYVALFVIFVISPLMMVFLARGPGHHGNSGRPGQ